jgi:hypothetical protein
METSRHGQSGSARGWLSGRSISAAFTAPHGLVSHEQPQFLPLRKRPSVYLAAYLHERIRSSLLMGLPLGLGLQSFKDMSC